MTEQKPTPQPPKLSVTSDAEATLLLALQKVNDGFLGGKVSKLDLASWAIDYALEDLDPAKIDKIRKAFFNDLAYLESLVKRSKLNGEERLSPDQLSALQSLFGAKPNRAKSKTTTGQ